MWPRPISRGAVSPQVITRLGNSEGTSFNVAAADQPRKVPTSRS